MVISGHANGNYVKYRMSTGALMQKVPGKKPSLLFVVNPTRLTCMVYSGSFLYIGSAFNVYKYDINSGIHVDKLEALSDIVNDIIVTDDHIFTCGGDSLIKQWFLTTFELVKTFTGHNGAIKAIALQDDILFSASLDGSVKMWTIVRAVELKSFKSFDDGVSSILASNPELFITMADRVIYLNPELYKFNRIDNFGQSILGIKEYHGSFYVASKAINSITVNSLHLGSNLVAGTPVNASISDSCSAFFMHSSSFKFWFGLRNGLIMTYSLEDSFRSMVTLCVFIIERNM
jgi:WD40 repeat protein